MSIHFGRILSNAGHAVENVARIAVAIPTAGLSLARNRTQAVNIVKGNVAAGAVVLGAIAAGPVVAGKAAGIVGTAAAGVGVSRLTSPSPKAPSGSSPVLYNPDGSFNPASLFDTGSTPGISADSGGGGGGSSGSSGSDTASTILSPTNIAIGGVILLIVFLFLRR